MVDERSSTPYDIEHAVQRSDTTRRRSGKTPELSTATDSRSFHPADATSQSQGRRPLPVLPSTLPNYYDNAEAEFPSDKPVYAAAPNADFDSNKVLSNLTSRADVEDQEEPPRYRPPVVDDRDPDEREGLSKDPALRFTASSTSSSASTAAEDLKTRTAVETVAQKLEDEARGELDRDARWVKRRLAQEREQREKQASEDCGSPVATGLKVETAVGKHFGTANEHEEQHRPNIKIAHAESTSRRPAQRSSPDSGGSGRAPAYEPWSELDFQCEAEDHMDTGDVHPTTTPLVPYMPPLPPPPCPPRDNTPYRSPYTSSCHFGNQYSDLHAPLPNSYVDQSSSFDLSGEFGTLAFAQSYGSDSGTSHHRTMSRTSSANSARTNEVTGAEGFYARGIGEAMYVFDPSSATVLDRATTPSMGDRRTVDTAVLGRRGSSLATSWQLGASKNSPWSPSPISSTPTASTSHQRPPFYPAMPTSQASLPRAPSFSPPPPPLPPAPVSASASGPGPPRLTPLAIPARPHLPAQSQPQAPPFRQSSMSDHPQFQAQFQPYAVLPSALPQAPSRPSSCASTSSRLSNPLSLRSRSSGGSLKALFGRRKAGDQG